MITGRPAALLALGAFGLAVAGLLGDPSGAWPWVVALALFVVLLALCAFDFAVAAPLGDVRLSRDGERSCWLGESTSVALTVHNDSPRLLRARVRDAWVPSAGPSPYEHLVDLDPGAVSVLETRLTPTRRGDRPAVCVTLRSYGPLGFAYRQHRARTAAARTPAWTLRVYPRFEARRLLPEKMSRLRVLDGAVVTRGRGQGTEFDALREYVIGDDVRSIDWRASARRSDVVVRSWRPERDRRVLCVLDTGRTSAARIGDEPRLDAGIDAALLLAMLAARAGDRVDLLAVDTAVRAAVANPGKRTLLWQLVTAMAPLSPALVETDFGLVASEVLRRERKRALVVLFTALEPGALAEGLLPVLPRLAARHRVVVAAVHDPALDTLAAAPRTSTGAVYRAAAAHRALVERDRVRQALTRYGVDVIDAPVEQFASKVADTYLALKRIGRL
ncbi:DUF58 domain-containing protein [Virgisporangium aurantiacum]|uniref:Lipoprotein n=1 Tax=Virgisporangium aurantiacum TaxID=175570 RepID=A0A8J4DWY9_9ACTN|nr:lipoprotein [Virgisporangium aurantiacum]